MASTVGILCLLHALKILRPQSTCKALLLWWVTWLWEAMIAGSSVMWGGVIWLTKLPNERYMLASLAADIVVRVKRFFVYHHMMVVNRASIIGSDLGSRFLLEFCQDTSITSRGSHSVINQTLGSGSWRASNEGRIECQKKGHDLNRVILVRLHEHQFKLIRWKVLHYISLLFLLAFELLLQNFTRGLSSFLTLICLLRLILLNK